jgi:hypothetical protein
MKLNSRLGNYGWLAVFILGLSLSSCAQKTEHPDGITIDYNHGLDISNQAAKDLIDNNAKDLYALLDEGFALRLKNAEDLGKVLQDMFGQYGRPLKIQLKACETGYRADGSFERPRRSYYYSCYTTKFPVGKFFVKVEVVPSRDYMKLGVTGFGIVAFPQGIPSFLK